MECAQCRAELADLRAAVTGLALDVPQMDPPASLKAKVMAAVRDDAQRRTQPAPRPARRRFLAPALSGGLAAVILAALVWAFALRSTSPESRTVAIATVRTAPAARGSVEFRPDGSAVMRITGLPALAAGKGYELWTIRDGTPRSEGFAALTPSGELVVATAELSGATALAITPEDRTNVRAPSVDPIVIVPVA